MKELIKYSYKGNDKNNNLRLKLAADDNTI